MTTHAQLSPSSADRWMNCYGSVALSEGIVDEGSAYAAEGTAAHEMAQLVLELGIADAERYIGKRASNGVEMTEDMANHIMVYVNRIRDYAKGHTLMVEQRLSIAHLTEEPDAKGTSDAVILAGDELQVHDLKYGMGVKVEAENNSQLMIYALAALREFEIVETFSRVRLVIHQPRLKHVSEWDISVELLNMFADQVKEAAYQCSKAIEIKPLVNIESWAFQYLSPSEDACRWCKAKADCPSLRDFVMSKVTGEDLIDYTQLVLPLVQKANEPIPAKANSLEENTLLANLLSAVDLIENWCTSIRGKVNTELRAGREVPGYKLVLGRKGARAWTNETEAEAIMKSMRLKVDEMYNMKVISPIQTEKLLANKPKCWKRIEPFITQSEGSLSVAPVSDKRPAVVVKVETFDDVSDGIEMHHVLDTADGLV